MPLTPSSPLPSRLMAWSRERFPPGHAVLFFVLYLAALLYGRFLVGAPGGGAIALGAADLVSFLAAWGFFAMLRVFDEHKDYELDCRNHPQRVLQSGLITLFHLKMLGAVAVAVQVGVSLWRDGGAPGPISARWALAMLWSALMAKEFFAPQWLRDRLLAYAFTHMLVMPLALLWMAQIGAGRAEPPPEVYLLAALSFFSGFAFEIARKLKAPEDERPTVDSYTKILGVRGAPLAIVFLLALGSAVIVAIVRGVAGPDRTPWVAAAAIFLALGAAIGPLTSFARAPAAGSAKKAEVMTSLSMLVCYVVLIATLIYSRGLTWA